MLRTFFGKLALLLGLLVSGFGARAADADVLSPDAALALASQGQLQIIDVRTPGEWADSGIPAGAAMIDLSEGAERFLAGVEQLLGGDKTKPIAVICRSGHRSTNAKRLLEANGYSHVGNIIEGVMGGPNGPGWKARGLPMEPR